VHRSLLQPSEYSANQPRNPLTQYFRLFCRKRQQPDR
jgi:hypothetical protein